MKHFLLLIIFTVCISSLFAQAPKPYGPIPTKAQLNWHEMEMYCIIHFGVDTYTDKEWGYGDESPLLINPTEFNAEQIVGAVKVGGFKGVVVVAKHHDGLCIWPTKTTGHNISASKWKNGKGDMVKDYQLACNKLNMQLGLYCSPWDRNNALYGQAAYLDIYRAQLKELYENYGPVFISWHDGANGGSGYYGGARDERKIDRSNYYKWPETWKMIRKWQPSAAIFGDVGPDVRWVGNEEGMAGETSWATYSPEAPEPGKIASNGFSQYWKSTEGIRDGKFWMPAECDVPMRPGWFYHANQNENVKTASELVKLYYQSVGRGANLNLGISPNPTGVLDKRDVEELKKFGEIIRSTFKINLLKDAKFKLSNIREGNSKLYGSNFLIDNDRYSYWATDDDVLHPVLVAELPKAIIFNVIQLKENIKLGQRIRALSIDAFQNGSWKEIAKATSIGANRLIRLNSQHSTSRIRLRITSSDASVAISQFGIYNEPPRPSIPFIKRSKAGIVSIVAQSNTTIYYTTNGSTPSIYTLKYVKPFQFELGGQVKAIAIDRDNISDIINRDFGQSKIGWKVLPGLTQTGKDLSKIIDDDPLSACEIRMQGKTDLQPVQVVVDMKAATKVNAFTFLPGIQKNKLGFVDTYRIDISNDGENWEQLLSGEFSNIKTNPVEQIIQLKKAVTIRYFKFIATHTTGGNVFSIAELGVR